MPTRDNTRRKINGLLRKLRSSGYKIVFEKEDDSIYPGGVKAALRGQEVYLAPLEPEEEYLCFNYHSACRQQGGQERKASLSGRNPSVTLEDGTFYQCFSYYPDKVPDDIKKLLERGHEFPDIYIRKLNSEC